MDPMRLALSITHADGRVTRWGPDEASAENIPQGLKFSTGIPPGFRDADLTLARPIGRDYPDLRLRDDVRIHGAGNRTAWEGRVHKLPRSHGGDFGIGVSCVGHARLLSERQDFVAVYVDRDPGRWTEADLARRIALASAALDTTIITARVENGQLQFSIPGGQAIPQGALSEWYYTPPAGVTLGAFGYRAQEQGDMTGYEPRTLYPTGASSVGLLVSDTFQHASLSAAASVLMLRLARSTVGSVTQPASGTLYSFKSLAVYGSHGLTRRAISGDLDGLYVPDIIAHIVSETAPGLNYTTGPGGSIQDETTVVLPHLVYADPTTGGDAILFANAYLNRKWGVYDGREFFFKPWDPDELTWRVRQSDGAHLSFEGEDAEEIPNGVFVVYSDPNGQRKTVGPPGARADSTDASLANTDPANPVNEHGEQYWPKLDISQTTTLAGAVAIGSRWLAERSLASRRGSLVVKGMGAVHPTEGPCPVWRMRAGDHVTVEDHSASVARRIISTDYDDDARTMTCALDNTSHETEALMELYGVALVGVV